jgi:hypothetical protein
MNDFEKKFLVEVKKVANKVATASDMPLTKFLVLLKTKLESKHFGILFEHLDLNKFQIQYDCSEQFLDELTDLYSEMIVNLYHCGVDCFGTKSALKMVGCISLTL